MKRAVYFFLLSILLLTACSKTIQEEQPIIRLPADSIEQEKKETYVTLEKITLRNEDVISKPYFFRDGITDGKEASYSDKGITACISLEKADVYSPSDLLENGKEKALDAIKKHAGYTGDITLNESGYLTEISYIKEVNVEQKDKTICYRYPCKYILKVQPLVDGNFLMISLEVDNEESDQMTQELLKEFLDAYGITFI